MITAEIVTAYINRLCEEIGADSGTVYNPETGAWYFSQGKTTLEVFLTVQKDLQQQPQTFIRCMAPLCEIPRDLLQQYKLYKTALAINAAYLGYKISADETRGLVCVIAERNIDSMLYGEMIALIRDLGLWADKLDQFLKAEFAAKS